jgi:hypothetical protein
MFQNINPLAKSTAVTEIIIMLLVALVIGYLLRMLQCWLMCNRGEKKVVTSPVSATPTKSNVSTSQKDDLKKIEGIGPAIEKLLVAAGITTFAQVADTSVEKIKSILDAAGPQFQIHGGETWAEQAKLARDGKWTEFDALVKELVNGKRV